MKILRVVCVLFLCGIASISIAMDLVIESLDGNGQLIFNEVPNVSTYRVEQASSLGGSWGFFTNIPPSGTGTITSSIPLAASAQFFRVVAELEPTPEGMALIPAGSFQMGDTFGEGSSVELPVHSVYVSGFYMDKYEVTKALWDEVYNWATNNSYSFDHTGSGKTANHPVHTVSWYDCAKWCNARSEMEDRTPCYNQGDWSCDFSANGYRLPTDAEWEKAARGGLNGKRYSWGDSIDHSKANYYWDPVYNDGVYPYSSPVGSFAPNGYGMYDMVGNMWEWCSDWHDGAYYETSPSSNPRGASTGSNRVVRGGSWNGGGWDVRTAYRVGDIPSASFVSVGFRAVLSAD